MKTRGFYTLFFAAVMLATALSVGNSGIFLLGAAALLAWALSLLSVLLAFATCRLTQEVSAATLQRGERVRYTLGVRMFSPLPVAPLTITVMRPDGRTSDYLLETRLIGRTISETEFSCAHVGRYTMGAMRMSVSDCFGLFRFSRKVRQESVVLTVLPKCRATSELAFSPGEDETTQTQRAQADRTTPADVRAWQEGDEMGRVHWKLSMRRQALMVHTYETPQRPDALVLLDSARPEETRRAQLIDAMTDVCAGLAQSLLKAERPLRMPLSGGKREITGRDLSQLQAFRCALAEEPFDQEADFARVLFSASRRMRRTGTTAIVTASLTPAVADAVIALRRMGPHTRLCYVCCGEPSEREKKLLWLLRSSDVETQCVDALTI